MLFNRQSYLTQFDQQAQPGVITVITGQRRSGKSSLVQTMLLQHSNTLLIDMEDFSNRDLEDREKLHEFCLKHLKNNRCDVLAIDEVQTIVGREKVVISLAKSYTQTKFVVTGSNSSLLSSELTTLLRGRYVQIHLLPFGYEEFLGYFTLLPSLESFQDYIQQGSFPYVYTLSDPKQKKDRIQNLINTIFLKDIIERYKIRNPELLMQLLLFVLDNTGSLTNIANIRNSLKQQQIFVTADTLQEYMHYLIDAYMIYPVDIYDLQGKKIFDRLRKYYPSDHVWRSILLGGFDGGASKTLETIVYFACIRAGWKVQVGKIKDKEVDFVLTNGEDKMYIQVAYLLATQEVTQREFASLQEIQDNYPKYIVSLDPLSLGQKDGIHHIQAWNLAEIL